VYSLGATLYHLLTGALPHDTDDDVGVVFARMESGKIAPPVARSPWLPKPLSSISMKALAAKPEERYASARALSDDIERWLGDEPVRAHKESAGERVFRWMRNHRTLATSLLVGYLVAAAAVVIGVIAWNHIQTQRLQEQQTESTSKAE
jgi:hypothetical protein